MAEIKVIFEMKPSQLDELSLGDSAAIELVEAGEYVFGRYAGLRMEHESREWFIQIETNEGLCEISTRERYAVHRITHRTP